MRLAPTLSVLLCVLVAAPAHAGWKAANPTVEDAAKQPRIAAAIAAAMRFDQAIVTHDAKVFADTFTDDAVVNNPFNRIARKPDAVANFATGLIDYTTLDRVIEYAATRGAHDVVLMGEEHLTRSARRSSPASRSSAAPPKSGPTPAANGSWRCGRRRSIRRSRAGSSPPSQTVRHRDTPPGNTMADTSTWRA
ncbi:nuclear transport factor 2 family protein [Pseudoxanthomonas sp. PXM01]|uniref:nuclear transport factor 2 family protein n=1 Tax=Pseudoxanthomonas sp. PXM01 TaxID=2769295 RepID=UPI0017854841|nr:nuclear transport factor 2 family protein [Pseudoxanthomonas sp. PXM01]MBD9467996.1 nuclear transport factor 2 family protein [Pseudoxanthomonas sp. PXM01]